MDSMGFYGVLMAAWWKTVRVSLHLKDQLPCSIKPQWRFIHESGLAEGFNLLSGKCWTIS